MRTRGTTRMTRDELVTVLTLNKTPARWWFTWNATRGRVVAGAVAGADNGEGYWLIQYAKKNYKAHRLVWLHETGIWPTGQIDHINGNPADNRFTNLREVTNRQNSHNRLAGKNSTTGVKGVSPTPTGRFRTVITVGGTLVNLGTYGTIGDAAHAYLTAAQQHHDPVAVERYQTAYAHILNPCGTNNQYQLFAPEEQPA